MDFFASTPAASASGATSQDDCNERPKVRSACNRCHSQKLRCSRKLNQTKCDRCLKLNQTCHFSPRAPRRSLNRAETFTRSTSHALHEPLVAATPTIHSSSYDITSDLQYIDCLSPSYANLEDIGGQAKMSQELCSFPLDSTITLQDNNWPGISFPLENLNQLYQDNHPSSAAVAIDALTTESLSAQRMGAHDASTQGKNPNDTVEVSSCLINKLAKINVSFHECAEKLPLAAGSRVRLSRNATIFAIDELFHLTHDFTEILKSVSLVDLESDVAQHPTECSFVDKDKQVLESGQYDSITDNQPPSNLLDCLDEATMAMVFACYCRLTEMYLSLFHMMQACIKHSLAPQLGNNWAVILPPLHIGSLVSPPVRVDANTPMQSESASSMYMLMIIMVSSQLWEQLQILTGAETGAGMSPVPSSLGGLENIMWNAILDKSSSMLQTIETLKDMLKEYPIIPRR